MTTIKSVGGNCSRFLFKFIVFRISKVVYRQRKMLDKKKEKKQIIILLDAITITIKSNEISSFFLSLYDSL